MKKTVLMVLFVFFCFLVNGCVGDPSSFYFSQESYSKFDKIVSIELGMYNNDDYERINVKEDTILVFDRTKYEVLEELAVDRNGEFLSDFSEVFFLEMKENAKEPIGYCLLINLQDGNYIVVSFTRVNNVGYGMFAEFDSNDNFVKHIARFDGGQTLYVQILDEYFESYVKPVE